MFTIDKAIIGAISAGILSLLAMINISGDMTVEVAINAIVTGLSTGILVYLKRNKLY